MQLPRIGFSITSMTYNGERKRQTTLKRKAFVESNTTDGVLRDKILYHHTEVPYDIEFSLYIMTSNMDDGLQVLEQILSYFTPEFTVTIKPSVLKDGDEIIIDAVKGEINVTLSDQEIEKRKKDWKPRKTNHNSGSIWKYSQTVGPAYEGAVTQPGAKDETHTYADI